MPDDQPVPAASPTSLPPINSEVEDKIKASLEYAILGRHVTVKVAGTQLTFKRWGLGDSISQGSRVMRLVTTVQALTQGRDTSDAEGMVALFAEIISIIYADVLEILVASVMVGPKETFQTSTQVREWLEENVTDLDEVFNLSWLVYDMNLKGDKLGKLVGGVGRVAQKLSSLSTSSSKS